MIKKSEELINELKQLTSEDLVKIVIKYARRFPEIHKELEFEYVKSESVEDLYKKLEQTIKFELNFVDGRIIQKQLAKSIANCINEINNFKKVTKSKYHEALALKYLLDEIFNKYNKEFGTCWRIFDSKVASVSRRFLNQVFTLHEDYEIDFKSGVERILKDVKKYCTYYNSIFDLPDNYEDLKIFYTQKTINKEND